MEDYALDIIIGKGPAARSIRIDLPKFTLIGATTRAGQMTTPLRDRFGVILKLELYTPIFAIARISGWSAHRLEELANNGKIIRPAYKSVVKKTEYIPLRKR